MAKVKALIKKSFSKRSEDITTVALISRNENLLNSLAKRLNKYSSSYESFIVKDIQNPTIEENKLKVLYSDNSDTSFLYITEHFDHLDRINDSDFSSFFYKDILNTPTKEEIQEIFHYYLGIEDYKNYEASIRKLNRAKKTGNYYRNLYYFKKLEYSIINHSLS